MKKNMVRRKIADLSLWDFDGADKDCAHRIIDGWFKDVDVKYSNLKLIIEAGYDYIGLELHGDREETDIEYNVRLKKENKEREKSEKDKLAHIERVREEAKKLGII